jgi:hypothetical protein
MPKRKAVRKERIYSDEVVEREAAKFGRDLNDALNEVAASARSESVLRSIQAGDAAAAVAAVNLDPMRLAIGGQQDRLGGEYLRQALITAGKMTAPQAILHFDMIEPQAVNYAAQRAGALISHVQQQVRDTVNGLVVDALQGDYTARTLAQQIERAIPLTARQAQTAKNVYTKTFERLVAEGKKVERAELLAQRASAKSAANALKSRASGIARTELMSASNAGRFSGFSSTIASGLDSKESRKEWITGGDPCPICDPLEGETVQWDEEFSVGLLMPPAHPNCRCVGVFLPGKRTQKQLHRDGTYSFDPTLGQSIRLAQISREYIHGRLSKVAHDEAWDSILNFRRL